jgi:NADPH-dependent ferric siderophore reductase
MTDISSQDQTSQMSMPRIERVRHELKRRELTVRTVEKLTPNMLRITLAGEDLADFLSASPDDHVKIFLPMSEGEPERRDYTPRRYDTAAGELVLDFAVHEAGPATQWALEAQVGSRLSIGGPRGSAVISAVKHWILVGDETALPSMGRRVEEAGPNETFTLIGAVTGPQEEQTFETPAQLRTIWVHRPLSQATDASGIIAALETVDIPAGAFAWIATEASVARAIRSYLTEKRSHPLPWLKAAGYWVQGQADAHEKLD